VCGASPLEDLSGWLKRIAYPSLRLAAGVLMGTCLLLSSGLQDLDEAAALAPLESMDTKLALSNSYRK